jgi:hypothetical protein
LLVSMGLSVHPHSDENAAPKAALPCRTRMPGLR